MTKHNLFVGTVIAAALGALSFNAQAAEPTGWYAGAGAGQSMVAVGDVAVVDGLGGYQFTPYFGLEGAFTNFGEVDVTGGVGELDAETFSLVAVGTVPFTDRFSAYAKAGFHRWDAEADLPGVGRADDDGTDPTYGLGLQYRFTDTVALRGEYSRFEMDDVDVDLAQLQVRFDF